MVRAIVQIAAQAEWSSLLDLLGANPVGLQQALGSQFVSLWQGDTEIIAVHGGTGKIHAAAMAQYAILTWNPALVAVIGTSGAVAPWLKPLDIVLADRTIVYDLDSGLDGSTDENIRDLTTDLATPRLPTPPAFPIYVGTVLTGDRDVTAQNVESLRARFDGLVADWESGAVARVCRLNNVRCVVLRGVSDTPYAGDTDQLHSYRQNTPVIMDRLWHLLTEVILDQVTRTKGGE